MKSLVTLLLLTFSLNAVANEAVLAIAKKYKNLITADRIQDRGDQERIVVINAKKLPQSVYAKLKKLDVTLYQEEEVLVDGKSEYAVLNNGNDGWFDNFKILDKNGQTAGYAFNVSECNLEECYGYDALYLDAEGALVYKSF